MENTLLTLIVGFALGVGFAMQVTVVLMMRRYRARLLALDKDLESLRELADERHLAALADLAALNERVSRLERGYRHPKVGEGRPLIRLIRP